LKQNVGSNKLGIEEGKIILRLVKDYMADIIYGDFVGMGES